MKITSRHGVDSRPLSEWLRDAWQATAGVRRFPLRRLAGAELSATVKRCSRAYSPGRPLLHAVQPIQRNNSGAASAVVRPKRRRTPRRKNCEYAAEHCRTACPLDSRSPIGSMLRERNASRSEELGARQASLFSTLNGAVAATRRFSTLQALVQDSRSEFPFGHEGRPFVGVLSNDGKLLHRWHTVVPCPSNAYHSPSRSLKAKVERRPSAQNLPILSVGANRADSRDTSW